MEWIGDQIMETLAAGTEIIDWYIDHFGPWMVKVAMWIGVVVCIPLLVLLLVIGTVGRLIHWYRCI